MAQKIGNVFAVKRKTFVPLTSLTSLNFRKITILFSNEEIEFYN